MYNLTFILEVVGTVGGIATILALMLGPMFYLGGKIENFRQEVRSDMNQFRSDMNEFRKESRDFHARMCILEEKNRK